MLGRRSTTQHTICYAYPLIWFKFESVNINRFLEYVEGLQLSRPLGVQFAIHILWQHIPSLLAMCSAVSMSSLWDVRTDRNTSHILETVRDGCFCVCGKVIGNPSGNAKCGFTLFIT